MAQIPSDGTAGGHHPSLVAKLSEIMTAVPRIPKRGRNDHHGYQYAMEADVVDLVRSELAARRVLMTMAVTGREVIPPATGKSQSTTILDLLVTFHDGDSGETLVFPWVGAGADAGEKGVYKALTGGEKYALMKTFLIPTGDDPENDKGDKTVLPPATGKPATSGDDDWAAFPEEGPVHQMAREKPSYVTDTREKSGPNWAAVFVTLSDGRECGIFRTDAGADTIIPMIQESHRSARSVFWDLQPSRKDPKKLKVAGAVWADEVAL